jgi:hypothetical protein
MTRSSSSPLCDPPEGDHDGWATAAERSNGGGALGFWWRRQKAMQRLGFGRGGGAAARGALNRPKTRLASGPAGKGGGGTDAESDSAPWLGRDAGDSAASGMTGGGHPSAAAAGARGGRRVGRAGLERMAGPRGWWWAAVGAGPKGKRRGELKGKGFFLFFFKHIQTTNSYQSLNSNTTKK